MLAESLVAGNTATPNLDMHIPGIEAIENMMKYWNDNYMTFSSVMQRHGYTWEAVKVKTEDGYTLTTFHVTGKVAPDGSTVTREATEPPVLVQHGLGSDAATWLWSYMKGVPLPLQLYDAGFDVWLGNNRGTEYS